jgi:hypothetical protein
MKVSDIRRAFEDAAQRLDDPTWIESNLNFGVGFLLGGENAWSAALMVALAEKAYGVKAHRPSRDGGVGLMDLKRRIGLAASNIEDFQAPGDD